MDDSNDKCRERWYAQLPQMGRARGLIAPLESVRQQGRGLRPLSTPVVGCGRAKFQALIAGRRYQEQGTLVRLPTLSPVKQAEEED